MASLALRPETSGVTGQSLLKEGCSEKPEVVEERESKPGYPSVTSDLFCDKCDLLFRKLSNSIIRKQQRFRKGQQQIKLIMNMNNLWGIIPLKR